VVTDATGQPLNYIYFEDESGRGDLMKRLTKDEARRIAANVTKLPEGNCPPIVGTTTGGR